MGSIGGETMEGPKLIDPKVCRIFLSSPFNGMEEERETLTKLYWPQINSLCAARGIQFRVVDMRWGITHDASGNNMTVNLCLKELDRSDIFIGFFGQRYGWHGENDAALQMNIDKAMASYPWVDKFRDRSVTELEFLHGHLNHPGDRPACVAFRDKSFDDLKREEATQKNDRKMIYKYSSEGAEAEQKMADLKRRCKLSEEHSLGVLLDYKKPFDAAKYLFDKVHKYLTEVVFAAPPGPPPSPRQESLLHHKAFIDTRTGFFVGNEKYSSQLSAFASKDLTRILLVNGAEGSGKSAMLCNWLKQNESDSNPGKDDPIIIYHFVGCQINTSALVDILERITGELKHYIEEYDIPESPPNETEKEKTDTDEKTKDSDENKMTDNDEKKTTDNENNTSDENDNKSTDIIETEESNKDSDDSKNKNNYSQEESKENGDKTSSDTESNKDKDSKEIVEKGDKNGESGTNTESENKKEESGTNDEKGKSDKNNEEDEEGKKEKKKTKNELARLLQKMIARLGLSEKKFIIIVDGLNKIDKHGNTGKPHYWIPKDIPQNVKMILSISTSEKDGTESITERDDSETLYIHPLGTEEKEAFCLGTLQSHSKELTEEQLSLVIDAEHTGNPLYLKTVIEELCTFGNFRQLTSRIEMLVSSTNVKILFMKYLERLEEDYSPAEYEGNLPKDVVSSICVARRGLSETELTTIFNIPSNFWTPLYFALERYLINLDGLFGFSCDELKQAVEEKYLSTETEKNRYSEKVAGYFYKEFMTISSIGGKIPRRVRHELPYLLNNAGDIWGLYHVITYIPLFVDMYNFDEYELIKYWGKSGWSSLRIAKDYIRALEDHVTCRYLNFIENGEEPKAVDNVIFRAYRQLRDCLISAKFEAGLGYLLEKSFSILEKVDGITSAKKQDFRLSAKYDLAVMYCEVEEYEKSKELHLEVLKERESIEPKTEEVEKDIGHSLHGLGVLTMKDPDTREESMEYFERSLKIYDAQKDVLSKSRCLTNMGLLKFYKKDHHDAINTFKDVLKLQEEYYFGELPPDVSYTFLNMGLCYRHLKQLDNCEKLYLKALEIKVNNLGWNNKDVGLSLMNLGTLCMHRKDYPKAVEYAKRSLAIYEQTVGTDQSELRKVKENLAMGYAIQEKYEEAFPYFWETFHQLKRQNAMEVCLPGLFRRMAKYHYKKGEVDKATMIVEELVQRKQVKVQDYVLLGKYDLEGPKHSRPKRPHEHTVDYAFEKYPTERDLFLLKLNDPLEERNIKKCLDIAEIYHDACVAKGCHGQSFNCREEDTCYYTIASMLAEDNEYKEAFEILDAGEEKCKDLEFQNEYHELLLQRSTILKKMGKPKEAFEVLERLCNLESSSKDPTFCIEASEQALHTLGDIEIAKKYVQRSKSIFEEANLSKTLKKNKDLLGRIKWIEEAIEKKINDMNRK